MARIIFQEKFRFLRSWLSNTAIMRGQGTKIVRIKATTTIIARLEDMH
jgi:hypothetical protein